MSDIVLSIESELQLSIPKKVCTTCEIKKLCTEFDKQALECKACRRIRANYKNKIRKAKLGR